MSFSFSKAAKGLVAGGVAIMIATSGSAALVQGTTGPTSTGSLDITLTILDEVRISGLSDIALGTFAGADLSGSSEACVYRSGTGAYNITATGNGTGSAFELLDGANSIPYTVDFSDDVLGTAPATLTSGAVLAGQTGGDAGSDVCAGTGNNALIEVNVLAADMAAAPAAAYTGILTLVVAPE